MSHPVQFLAIYSDLGTVEVVTDPRAHARHATAATGGNVQPIMYVPLFARCVATARLFAAAPELLAACKEAYRIVRSDYPDWMKEEAILETAIAAATGKTK